jgi:hypothetical protein
MYEAYFEVKCSAFSDEENKLKHLRYSLFWDVMQRGLVVSHRHFGTLCRSTLQESNSPYRRKTLVLWKVVVRNVGKRSCWRRPWDILNVLQSRYFPNVILQLYCCIINASYFISWSAQRNLLQPYISRYVSPLHRPRRPLGRVEVQLYSVFDLGTKGGEGSASRSGRAHI